MTVSVEVNPNLSPSQILAQIYQEILNNGGSGYTLPIASDVVLGGIKIGSGLIIDPATGVVTASDGSGIPQGGPLTQNLDAGGFSLLGFSDLVDASSNSFESLFNGTGGIVLNCEQTPNSFSSFFDVEVYDPSYDLAFINAVNAPSGLVGLNADGDIPVGTLGLLLDSGSGIIFQNTFSGSLNGFFANNDSNAGLVSNGFVFYIEPSGNLNANGAVIADSDGNLFSGGNPVTGLFDGSEGLVATAVYASQAGSSNADGLILHGTDGSTSGIAAFQIDGSFAQASVGDIQTLLNDSGWTANADAGDKTVVIGSTASLTTIATALNIVSSGSGTALLNIAQKVKAIEFALANGHFPNA